MVYNLKFIYPPIVPSAFSILGCNSYLRDILQLGFQLRMNSPLLMCWLVLDRLRRQGYQFFITGCGVMATATSDHCALQSEEASASRGDSVDRQNEAWTFRPACEGGHANSEDLQ